MQASAPPRIFDRDLVRWRLARARSKNPATFLLDRAVEDLTERLGAVLRPFPRVLDLGTPTPQLAAALAQSSERVITRLAPLPEPPSPLWRTVTGDEEALPFAPESFDLVVSALALQSVNDLPGTLIQIRRALSPDGLLMACLFGGQTLNELRTAFAAAEEERMGGVSPRVAPFADVRDLGALMQRAGFALAGHRHRHCDGALSQHVRAHGGPARHGRHEPAGRAPAPPRLPRPAHARRADL